MEAMDSIVAAAYSAGQAAAVRLGRQPSAAEMQRMIAAFQQGFQANLSAMLVPRDTVTSSVDVRLGSLSGAANTGGGPFSAVSTGGGWSGGGAASTGGRLFGRGAATAGSATDGHVGGGAPSTVGAVPVRWQFQYGPRRCTGPWACTAEDLLAGSSILRLLPLPRGIVSRIWEFVANDTISSFGDVCLHSALLTGIREAGLDKPSIVQRRTLRPILDGRDVCCIAPCQIGSAMAAVIACFEIAHRLSESLSCTDPSTRVCKVIILVPTRETAVKIGNICDRFGAYSNIRSWALYGRHQIVADIDKLRQGQDVVISGTGGVVDMVTKRHLRVDNVAACVLLGTDEIIARGFNVSQFIGMLPARRQICSFSQKFAPERSDVVRRLMQDPRLLRLSGGMSLSLASVHEFYVAIEKPEWKLDTLWDVLETLTFKRAVICCKDRRTLNLLVDELSRRDYTTTSVHPLLDQRELGQALRSYRSGGALLLIAMDFSANSFRDLDADWTQTHFVINFDWPLSPEQYLLRIGTLEGVRRVALNFLTEDELRTIKDMEKLYGTRMEEMPMYIADLI